jgi:hypothetical protein
MCKEMPVIPVNKVVDPKRIIGKKWRAAAEERHQGVADPPKNLAKGSELRSGFARFRNQVLF